MTDKFISIEGIAGVIRAPMAARPPCSRISGCRWARRVRLRDRAFRLRQDHGAEYSGRPRRAERGHGHRRRAGDRGHQPRPRRDLPESRAAAVAHGARQRRLRRDLEMAQLGSRQGEGARAELHRPGRPDRFRAQATVGIVRRHEAARRHRTRALDHAKDHADGRAVLGARRADARHAAGRGTADLSGDRADRLHDHP